MRFDEIAPPPRAAGRILQLDILRGVAILMVLANHQFWNVRPDSRAFGFLCDLSSRIGWTGVDLFFILSGFLIGSLLFNELRLTNKINFKRFLIRRGLKIWPAYYVFVLYAFLVQCARLPVALDVTHFPVRDSYLSAFRGVASNLLNIQNYAPTIRPHTWSLAVEEHFYVLLPLVLLGLTRGSRSSGDWTRAARGIPAVAMVLVVGCNLLRFRAAAGAAPSFSATQMRIDELFFGVLLAYWNCLRPGFIRAVGRRRGALLGVGVGLVALLGFVAYGDGRYRVPLAILISIFGYGAILMAFLATPVGVGWLGRLMGSGPARLVAYVGTYSYSIYLWHLDFAHAPLNWIYQTGGFGKMGTSKTWIIASIAYVVAATAAGVGMSRLIEGPALKLRETLFPRKIAVLTE